MGQTRPEATRRGLRDIVQLRTRVGKLLAAIKSFSLRGFLSLVGSIPGQDWGSRLRYAVEREFSPHPAPYTSHFALGPNFSKQLKALLLSRNIKIVVVEQPGWWPLIELCHSLNVSLVCCPQNFESLLYDGKIKVDERYHLAYKLDRLAEELQFYQKCHRKFFISKVEAGFAQGLNLPGSHYYPYFPVGELGQRFAQVAAFRASHPPNQGLCLLIGSFGHPPIGDGMSWLLGRVRTEGLPDGLRLVVVGKGSEVLAPEFIGRDDVQFRGWVSDEELDELLRSVTCALVPLRFGFGGVTRLAELPRCRIPVIASSFAVNSVDSHPLIRSVPNNWTAWCEALSQVGQPASEAPWGVGPDVLRTEIENLIKEAAGVQI